jgi:hypothetical protein
MIKECLIVALAGAIMGASIVLAEFIRDLILN